jgi:hypothetical protein
MQNFLESLKKLFVSQEYLCHLFKQQILNFYHLFFNILGKVAMNKIIFSFVFFHLPLVLIKAGPPRAAPPDSLKITAAVAVVECFKQIEYGQRNGKTTQKFLATNNQENTLDEEMEMHALMAPYARLEVSMDACMAQHPPVISIH